MDRGIRWALSHRRYSRVQLGCKSNQWTQHRDAISGLAVHCFSSRGTRQLPRIQDLEAQLKFTDKTPSHMKHYGEWTDEAGLDAAFGAANARLITRFC